MRLGTRNRTARRGAGRAAAKAEAGTTSSRAVRGREDASSEAQRNCRTLRRKRGIAPASDTADRSRRRFASKGAVERNRRQPSGLHRDRREPLAASAKGGTHAGRGGASAPPRPATTGNERARARSRPTRPAGRRAGRRAMELGQWGLVATPAPTTLRGAPSAPFPFARTDPKSSEKTVRRNCLLNE
jgi:hypothetical protein